MIGTLQSDLARLKKAYAQLLRQYHRQMQTQSPALLVLSAKDVNQALRRSRHLKQYNAYRREQANAIVELQNEMTQKEKILEVEKSEKEVLKTQEEANKQELRKESQQQDKIVKALQKTRKNFVKNYAIRKLLETNSRRASKIWSAKKSRPPGLPL